MLYWLQRLDLYASSFQKRSIHKRYFDETKCEYSEFGKKLAL